MVGEERVLGEGFSQGGHHQVAFVMVGRGSCRGSTRVEGFSWGGHRQVAAMMVGLVQEGMRMSKVNGWPPCRRRVLRANSLGDSLL